MDKREGGGGLHVINQYDTKRSPKLHDPHALCPINAISMRADSIC